VSVTPDQVESEIVERIKPLGPLLIMLFGSRAQGRPEPDSDYDVLVVMHVAGETGYRHVPVRLALGDLGAAFDIIVYTPEEWEAWQHHPLGLANHIRETGRVLYAERPDSGLAETARR
jgi:predicted nucleotidyltransferase